MANKFDPSGWIDGTTVPHASDYQNIAYDIAHRGQSLDGASYPGTNLGFLQLNAGDMPGNTYTVTAAAWTSGSGGQATYTISTHSIQVGQLISVTGASPTGWNITLVPVVSITGTTVTVAMTANPGTWTSGGTVQSDGVAAAEGMVKIGPNGSVWVYGAAGISGWSKLTAVVENLTLTAQAANISSATLLAAQVSGLYKITIAISVTQAATSSCTLPSVGIGYTQEESSAAISLTPVASSNTNATTNVQTATVIAPVKAATNITYQTASYASSGATPMQYSLHITVEFLG